MQFLLDENVHHGLVTLLEGLGHDAKLSPKGLTNGDVFNLAVAEKRILVTHDTDFTKKLFPTVHPGLVVIRIPSRKFAQLQRSVQRLLGLKKTPKDFSGMLILLWEDKIEELPYSFSEE